jgi:outer membrane protein assembly factor BamB
MLNRKSRPRRGQAALWASAVLFALFAALSVCMWFANRARFDADPKLIEGLKTAELLDEPAADADAGWPQWRGPRRDGVVLVRGLPTQWPDDGPTQLWEKDVSANESYSAFAVNGGRVFTLLRDGGNEVIVCWKLDDGTEVWRKSYPSGVSANDNLGGYGAGPRSTPTLHDGLVYTVGAGGRFQCRKMADGELVWEKDLLKDYGAPNLKWGTAFSPLVDGDLVFTNPGGPDGKSLVAFDRKTGVERWHSQSDPAGYSSPVAIDLDGERQIVFFTGTHLVGVTAGDGTARWRYPWPTEFGVNAATPITFRAMIDGKPQPFVFISSGYGKGCALVALARKDGRFEAQRVFESNSLCSHFGSPVRLGDHVYGFNETTLVCLSLRTGEERWKKNGFKKGSLLAVRETPAPPAQVAGLVGLPGSPLGPALAVPPLVSTPAAYLLVLAEDGKLALMPASPDGPPGRSDGPQIVTQASRLMGRRCWTMPVLADGRLLLRDEDKIRCLDLRTK